MVKLILRAIPIEEGELEKDIERYYVQKFEYWDEQEDNWKLSNFDSNTLFEERKLKRDGERGTDLFEQWLQRGEYDEIQLQPLQFDRFKFSVNKVERLMNNKANGLALMRRFWRGDLTWVPHKQTRLTWKYDDDETRKEMYTMFDKGEWRSSGSDKPEFVRSANQTELRGLNLTGLKLKRRNKEVSLYDSSQFPRKFSYTLCIRSELDGIKKATSFRGAFLHETRFCGRSTLSENDLTSTICYETHFDFAHVDICQENIKKEKGVKQFKSICLDGASFIDRAIFDFKDSDFQAITNSEEAEYRIDCYNSIFKYLSVSRGTLTKHKSELAYVVDELERLRKYEAKKDNWQEIIDSWIAFRKMSFETKKAVDMQKFLFDLEDSKKLSIIGKVLYSMDDEPPYGLLARIKTHVGETILRNEDYYTNKQTLTDEIENINSILLLKDRIETTIQNLVLGIFIFFFTIGANIVSDKIEKWLLDNLD